ncbi:MAG: CpaF family protein [Bdellovibrionales bacterium]
MKENEAAEQVECILQKYEKAWSFDSLDLERPSADELLRQMIGEAPEMLRVRLHDEFFGLGPLVELATDKSIQEIVVNGAREIWFERSGVFSRHPDGFLSDLTYKNFVDRLCAAAQIKVDLAQPFADGRWLDFRVHLGCAPLTHCHFHLTLRRLPENPWTLTQLVAAEWASQEKMDVLKTLVLDRKNILFLGPTGCGKTTVLGACLKELPLSERVVILEDTDELPRPNSASTKMLTRSHACASLPEVSLTDLVRQSLRMRPFRIVMGEVRGGEAKDLLLALATGHSGSLGTLHASEARQALLRLEMLVQLGAPQWSVQAIRQLIQLSVDALVVCGNSGGHRRLEGIYKVAALESFGFLLEPL